ncbi:MAG: class I SAM-dependent methyltransferase [Actinomycetota bacterium]|nr:class I SAM-dependent methyltransferase [Actinomycetota bacterium]
MESKPPPASLARDHPWTDGALAELYDLFPFERDIPFYLELASSAGPRVLELACGSGRLLVPLARAGHTVMGLDSSRPMLARAQARLERAGQEIAARVGLVNGDMRSFELDERFDLAIVAVRSFAYIRSRPDQQAVLGASARQLRPGGLLALDLLNPTPAWLAEPPGSRRQDLAREVSEEKLIVTRTETVVLTDLAAQVRVIRSEYELIDEDGAVRKRIVEWPFRYTYRFEAEHLLERAGFEVEAVYGGYEREDFTSTSETLLVVGRKASDRRETAS